MASLTCQPIPALPPPRTPTPHRPRTLSPSLRAPTGSREIWATERSGPFQIGIRYRFPGRRHCHARSLCTQAAEAEAVAAGWRTPTSPRCPGPLATTARIHSPQSRQESRGENRTRLKTRNSLLRTAAAPMALKCTVFSSGDRDEVGGGKSAWGVLEAGLGVGGQRPSGLKLREEQVQPGRSQAQPAHHGPGELECRPRGAGVPFPFAAGDLGSPPLP